MTNSLPTLLEREKTKILGRFSKLNDWMTEEIFWQICESLRTNQKLAEAAEKNPNSVITALMDLAQWGLPPDGREAFINVYRIDGVLTAQAQWIWQGGVRRAVDSGVIAHAVADIIRDGDSIEEIVDHKGRHLIHKRDISHSNRKLIGSYALFWLKNGLMDYELCDLADIERAKEASKRQVGKLTPAWQYSEPEQAKKTAIRRGLKRMVGKRDAGFESMVAPTRFDAETTSKELPPDDLPQGQGKYEAANAAMGADAAADAAEETETEGDGVHSSRLFNQAECDDLRNIFFKANPKDTPSSFGRFLWNAFGVRDPGQLHVSQIKEFHEKIAEYVKLGQELEG